MTHPVFAARPWFSARPAGPTPVGMLGEHEAAMFEAMAAEVFRGEGVVVDAGSFVGKSAFHLARGLRANPRHDPVRDRIHCFDLFRVDHYTTVPFLQQHLGMTVRIGDSIRPLFERQVAPVRDLLVVHEGDLHVVPWVRQPIEILMVDVAKTESLCRRVVEMFFADLVPGTSYVIHQDYHHAWHPYIHVLMAYLDDCFELVAPRVDASATFFLHSPIPPEKLAKAMRLDFTAAEQTALLARAVERLPPVDRPTVELLRLVAAAEVMPPDQVLQRLAEFEQQQGEALGDAFLARELRGVVDHFLEQDGWHQHRLGRDEQVLQRADALLARGRTSWSVHALRGAALRRQGRYEAALPDLRAAVAASPRSGFVASELAIALTAVRGFDEAVAAIEVAAAGGQMGAVEVRNCCDALGVVFLAAGEAAWCLQVMARLQPTLGREGEYWLLMARIHSVLGDRAAAASALAKAANAGASAARRAEVGKLLGLGAGEAGSVA